jgi:hypothetical protein
MKKVLYTLLTLCLLFTFCDDAFGQKSRKRKRLKQRFRAGVVAGFNLSQIDGDLYSGFDKINFEGGICGTARFDYRSEIVIEFLYVGKGSRFGNFREGRSDNNLNNSIAMHYVEVPFLFRHKWNSTPKGYFVEVGVSFARLIGTQIDQLSLNSKGIYFDDFVEDFERNEFTGLAGVGYQFSDHFGIKLRVGVALNRFFDRRDEIENKPVSFGMPEEKTVVSMRNYRLGFSGVYFF